MIAALFVEPAGCYADVPGVDLWDEERDARKYAGPWPVVAHPPCTRWCRLAGLVEHRWGLRKGDDGGCFEAALRAVRTWGGILEHPAYSDAWPAFGLEPPSGVGWQKTIRGEWVAHVEQSRYGHLAKKATWLFASGIDVPPLLAPGKTSDRSSLARVSWCHWESERGTMGERPRLGKKAAIATPHAFRDLLIEAARSARLPLEVA